MLYFQSTVLSFVPWMMVTFFWLLSAASIRSYHFRCAVTHDMGTARKVADRVVMLLPLDRLETDENQIIFDGTIAELEACRDRRVQQFINGEAGERLMELRASQGT